MTNEGRSSGSFHSAYTDMDPMNQRWPIERSEQRTLEKQQPRTVRTCGNPVIAPGGIEEERLRLDKVEHRAAAATQLDHLYVRLGRQHLVKVTPPVLVNEQEMQEKMEKERSIIMHVWR